MGKYSNSDPSSVYQAALSYLPPPVKNGSEEEVEQHIPSYAVPSMANRYRRSNIVSSRSLPVTGLNVSDYHPSPVLSPVKLEGLQNPYWGSLPVITGGETYFPRGVVDTRKAQGQLYNAQMAAEKQKILDNAWASYKMVQGEPNYQNKLNVVYEEGIANQIDDLFETDPLAFEKLANPFSHERQMLDQNYSIYQAAAEGSKHLNDAFKDAQGQLAAGKALDANTKATLDRYFNGEMSIPELIQSPRSIRTWQTMNDIIPDIQKMIGDDVRTAYEQGIDVTDEKGNKKHLTYANDGDMIINAIEKSYTDPEKIKYLIDNVVKARGVTLNPDYSPEDAAAFINNILPNTIKEQFHALNSNKTNVTVNVDKPMKTFNLQSNQSFTTNFAAGDKVLNLPVTGNNGFSAQPTEISFSTQDLFKYNVVANKDHFGDATATGKFVGAYNFPVNKEGVMVPDGNSKKTGYRRFAVVQVQEANAPSSADMKNLTPDQLAALLSNTKVTKTYFLPFDSNIQNQVDQIVPNEVDVNKEIVPSKETYTDEKKKKVGSEGSLNAPPSPDNISLKSLGKQ